jgi:hypothetical protein
MKIPTSTLCFLVILTAVRADTPAKMPLSAQPGLPKSAPTNSQGPPSRKNVQVSTPLPFVQDMSTQPIGQQAYNAFQTGFPNSFGSFSTHNPTSPSFSVDPMISSGSISMASPHTTGAYPISGQPLTSYAPLVRNDHSLTRYSDDNLAFGGVSLRSGLFPKLKAKDRCAIIQQQAVQVANNLVKRQNKVIFKELMDYILKSKFLIGMTEVKLNRVLRRKFVALMKKYTVLSDDNVRLISSEDDEILDNELEDEDDNLSDKIDYNDPFKSNSVDIDEENMGWQDRDNSGNYDSGDYSDMDNGFPTIVPDIDDDPILQKPDGQGPNTVAPIDESPGVTDPPAEEKKPWYKRIFDWKQQRALQARKAQGIAARQPVKQGGRH